METLIFNADFEWQLFQNKQTFKSSRKTQEFEYLINWQEPRSTIYTIKKYSKEYQRWFFKFNHEAFKFSDNSSDVRPWCGNYQQIELKRKLQDKSKTLSFAAKYDLGPQNFSLINDSSQVEPGFLYKYPKSLSGMGHYHFQDKDKINNLLNGGEILTKEKILNRTLDFSTLWEGGVLQHFYRNIVTDNYQYRGTLLERETAFLTQEQLDYFDSKTHFLKGWIEDIKGVISIDSFIYQDQGRDKVYFLSEINCRKTMGFSAIQLANKFFSEKKIVKFVFGNYRVELKDYETLYSNSGESVLALSPEDNKFKCFLIGANSVEELLTFESLLS